MNVNMAPFSPSEVMMGGKRQLKLEKNSFRNVLGVSRAESKEATVTSGRQSSEFEICRGGHPKLGNRRVAK